jgi:predicted transcriptional regulator
MSANRVNVVLDDEHAQRLQRLAERAYVNPGTLARSLLSAAIDQADLDGETMTAILDGIPGAWDRLRRGRRNIQEGRSVPLEDL